MAMDPLFSVSFPDRRSCARVLRGRARFMLVVLGMLLGILPPLAAQEKQASPLSLAGTYTFLSDSGGGQGAGERSDFSDFRRGEGDPEFCAGGPKVQGRGVLRI